MLYVLLIFGLAQLLALSSLSEAAAHPMFTGSHGRHDWEKTSSQARPDRAEVAAMMQVYYDDAETGATKERRDGRLFLSMINDIQEGRLVRQSLCSAVVKTVEQLSQQVEVRNSCSFC